MTEIIMPKAGMDMQEGRLIRWLKNVGDKVVFDEPIMEIETDKITMEVEAPADGVILAKYAEEGTVIPVLQVIGYIGKEGEVPPPYSTTTQNKTEIKTSDVITEIKEEISITSTKNDNDILATPYAKKTCTRARYRPFKRNSKWKTYGNKGIRCTCYSVSSQGCTM